MSAPFAIRKTGQKLPTRNIIYGAEGVGKTGFAAQFPDPFFLLAPRENGLETLIDSGQIPEIDHPDKHIESWNDLSNKLSWIESGEHSYRTLVLDTLNGFSSLYINEDLIPRDYQGKPSLFYEYGRSKTEQHPRWAMFLNRLAGIHLKRRMGMVLIAHNSVANFKNPEGHEYGRFAPRMNPQLWEMTYAFADNAFFFNFETVTTKEGLRAKATDTGKRFIHTTRTAAFDAKNRFNLPSEIEMGSTAAQAYANLVAAIRNAKANNVAANSKTTAPVPTPVAVEPSVQPARDQGEVDADDLGRIMKSSFGLPVAAETVS